MAGPQPQVRFDGVSGKTESGATSRAGLSAEVLPSPLLLGAGLMPEGEPVGFTLEPPRASRDGTLSGRVGHVVVESEPVGEDHAELVIVRNDAGYRILLPGENGASTAAGTYRLPVASVPGTRGVLGAGTRWLLQKFVFPKIDGALGRIGNDFVRRWEDVRRPHRMRLFTPSAYGIAAADEIEPDAIRSERLLLIVHGTNSLSHSGSGIGALSRDVVERFNQAYGQVIAFDHPTLGTSPIENANWLVHWLEGIGIETQIDVLCHSRGGLVTRLIVEQPDLLVQHRRPHLRSVAFVATPHRGTPLADVARLGRFAERLLSLAAVIPDNPVTAMVEGALTVAKQLAVGFAGGLEGLTCMVPGGPFLQQLEAPWKNSQNGQNGQSPARPNGDVVYRALVADYEPQPGSGWWHTLKDGGLDAVFGGLPNDVIVPTLSSLDLGSGPGVGFRDRVVFDDYDDVAHSSYFSFDLATRALSAWLQKNPQTTPPELRNRVFSEADTQSLADVGPEWSLGRKVLDFTCVAPEPARADLANLVKGAGARLWQYATGRGEAKPPPIVVLVPGVMGSQLSLGGRPLWISPWQLAQGRFASLGLPPPQGDQAVVADDVLCLGYRAALEFFNERHFDVVAFPYDWRGAVDDAAKRLLTVLRALVDGGGGNGGEPVAVHIVAHSMGGLVVRRARQLDGDRNVFGRLTERGGHIVLAGTPNHGSFAMPLALTGEHAILANLARLDIRRSRDEWLDVVWTFPGIWQLLPRPGLAGDPAGADGNLEWLYEADVWRHRPMAEGDRESRLMGARTLHDNLASDDGSGLTLILGDAVLTPVGLRRSATAGFEVVLSDAGDGTVAVRCGQLKGSIIRYALGVEHGNLLKDEKVLRAVVDLLDKGSTGLLREEPWSGTGRGADNGAGTAPQWLAPSDAMRRLTPAAGGSRGTSGSIDALTRAEALDVTLEALAPFLGTSERSKPPLLVSLVHAGLEQAQFPLLVGHGTGTPLSGAEERCDQLMGGELSNLQLLGLYPDSPGQARYVPNRNENPRLEGVLVVALDSGEPLTQSTLSDQVTRAVLDYSDRRRTACSDVKDDARLAISAVLVGTGPVFGLGIDRAVTAIVEGVLSANEVLISSGLPVVRELELVERYAAKAEHAMTTLTRLTDRVALSATEHSQRVQLQPNVDSKDGALSGIPPPQYESGRWEHLSVEVKGKPEATRTLEYRFARDRAAAAENRREVNWRVIASVLREAAEVPSRSLALGAMLFEALLPLDLKEELARTENLVLQVDQWTADVPWELLVDRLAGEDALACHIGVLRQFREHQLRRRTGRAPDAALVIADPPTDLPSLPQARAEGQAIALRLREAGMRTTHLDFSGIDKETSARHVLEALWCHDYRIVHVAAHGLYQVKDQIGERSIIGGVAIGNGAFLTADDFRNLRVAPDLVFLNCCHLALIDVPAGEGLLGAAEQGEAAASLARALMATGVRAVVVAGWQVGDGPAEMFAKELYAEMLAGVPYGDAVRKARASVYETSRGADNTWAAYQCYGDPGFRLRRAAEEGTATGHGSLGLRTSATRELDELIVAACEVDEHQVFKEKLAGLEASIVRRWPDDGELLDRCGRAWAHLGEFQKAIDQFEAALTCGGPTPPVATLERLTNLCSRLALHLYRADPDDEAAIDKLLDQAQCRNAALDLLPETAERLALRAGQKKRLALIRPAHREALLSEALEQYIRSASLSRRPSLYSFNNAVQLAALSGVAFPAALAADEWLDRWNEELARDMMYGSFWARIERSDCALTALVARLEPGIAIEPVQNSRPTLTEHLADGSRFDQVHLADRYKAARRGGHWPRDWWSVTDQIWTLAQLAVTPETKDALRDLYTALNHD